jgi:molybdate transport system substrate-binding protein
METLVTRRRAAGILALVAATVLLAGCGGEDDSGSPTANPAAGGADPSAIGRGLEGGLTVSAAASLTDAFTELGDDLTAANPELDLTFNYDSSSALVTQIGEGAPADVVAVADEADMAELAEAGLIASEPRVFARNEMVIVTKTGNPEGIAGLADHAEVGVVSLCAREAPCGRYAERVLTDADVSIPEGEVTRAQNATATLSAVSEGDAVAGIVYASDVVRAGDAVEAVTIPAEVNVVADYPIASVEATGNTEAAEGFMDYVLGPEGQDVLARHGFLPAS